MLPSSKNTEALNFKGAVLIARLSSRIPCSNSMKHNCFVNYSMSSVLETPDLCLNFWKLSLIRLWSNLVFSPILSRLPDHRQGWRRWSMLHPQATKSSSSTTTGSCCTPLAWAPRKSYFISLLSWRLIMAFYNRKNIFNLILVNQ